MIAFHGEKELKNAVIARMKEHMEADALIQNYDYFDGEKGCAVGCTIHGSDHTKYETELGIPVDLAYLEEGIFEKSTREYSKTWPLRFLEAIPVGADLSLVVNHFLTWLLIDKDYGVIRFAQTEKEKKAIQNTATLHQRVIDGDRPNPEEWAAARDAAWAAARGAARGAAWDAAWAAARGAAWDAAWGAAWDAAWAAARDAAWDAAWGAARDAYTEKCGEKLLMLLANAPVQKETTEQSIVLEISEPLTV